VPLEHRVDEWLTAAYGTGDKPAQEAYHRTHEDAVQTGGPATHTGKELEGFQEAAIKCHAQHTSEQPQT
jgi:hypothetical protein